MTSITYQSSALCPDRDSCVKLDKVQRKLIALNYAITKMTYFSGGKECIYAYINLAGAGIKMHGKGEGILLFYYIPQLESHSFHSLALKYKWTCNLSSEPTFGYSEIS